MNDDHGDQFAGAVPATSISTDARPAGADDRLVRMNAAYTEKVNAALEAGRDSLAHELAEQTFAEEIGSEAAAGDLAPARRADGRRTSLRNRGGRPPTTLGRLTRRSLRRFDRADRSA